MRLPPLLSRSSSPLRALGAIAVLAASLLSVGAPPTAQSLYWDTNSTTAGAGATPNGTWSTANGAPNRRWNTSAAGTASTSAWTSGAAAVFSAGRDAVNPFTVTLSGTQNAGSINLAYGTATFSSGTINLNDATPNFTVAAGATATVDSGLTGASGLTKLGDGTLIFGTSDKAYTGTTTVSAGTPQLDFDQSFDTVDLGGGTLRLGSASSTIGTLNITGNSTIDFAGAAATLSLTNLMIGSGVTLSIVSWNNATDFFYANNWTGAASDTTGSAPMNQVVFNGFAGTNTRWRSYDHQITPVPEPATYGAILLGALGAVAAFRRWRQPRTG